MKKLILSAIMALCSISLLQAQSWKLCTGKKTIAKGYYETIEEAGATTVTMSSKYKNLKIQNSEQGEASNISILVTNEEKQEVERYEFNNHTSKTVSLPMAKIKAAIKKSKKIHISIVRLPADPNKAAVVRVRPVYLFTLQ
jgi:hypothetical protein